MKKPIISVDEEEGGTKLYKFVYDDDDEEEVDEEEMAELLNAHTSNL